MQELVLEASHSVLVFIIDLTKDKTAPEQGSEAGPVCV